MVNKFGLNRKGGSNLFHQAETIQFSAFLNPFLSSGS